MGIRGEQACAITNDIKFNVEMGTSYTLIVDNTILAIAGVLVVRAGVGELWSIGTSEIVRNPKFYLKASRWGIEDGFEQLGLRRLQTVCGREDSISYNWQKRLGFEFEGIMKSYNDDGTDAVRMAMTCGQRKTPATA